MQYCVIWLETGSAIMMVDVVCQFIDCCSVAENTLTATECAEEDFTSVSAALREVCFYHKRSFCSLTCAIVSFNGD